MMSATLTPNDSATRTNPPTNDIDVGEWHEENRLTDEELLRRYRDDGDRDAFAQLVQRYEGELYNYLRRYLNDPELAEDAFQNTFLQVHLKCEMFDPGRRFRPWLYTVATNQAIDARRRTKRHRLVSLDRAGSSDEGNEVGKLLDLLESNESNPMLHASAAERQAWVRQAMDDLPEHLSCVVNLVYYQGMKYRDAAEVLDIPVGTVKSRLHAAVLNLSSAWKATHVENN